MSNIISFVEVYINAGLVFVQLQDLYLASRFLDPLVWPFTDESGKS